MAIINEKNLYKNLELIETMGLNVHSYIPGASTATGIARIFFGGAQLVSAGLAIPILFIASKWSPNNPNYSLSNNADLIKEIAKHSFLNLGRGFIELIPLVSSFVFGIYDCLMEVRCRYPHQNSSYPLPFTSRLTTPSSPTAFFRGTPSNMTLPLILPPA